jgi:outer membrane protein OmpA-like peptidoglycan-associated protein
VTALDRAQQATEEQNGDVAKTAASGRRDAAPGDAILALQRGAGNTAVTSLLTRRARASATVARDPTPEAPPATPDAKPGGDAAASPIAGLAAKAGSAEGLRAMLAAAPGLGPQIVSYFATGADDQALNQLMAQAFPPVAAQPSTDTASAGKTSADKNPADATVKLPDPITNTKTLDKGTMKWTLKADSQSSARCDIDFKPNETKVEAKTVSFGQTVVNQLGAKNFYAGATPEDPEANKSTYQPFEEPGTKKRMDLIPDKENDPFYGAIWDQASKKWVKESDDYVPGSSTKDVGSTSAKMFDIPGAAVAREGKGDVSKQFETVPMILETRQPLGSLKWGFKIKDEPNAPIELTGGTPDDCVDTPSDDWGKTMDQFYAGRFEEILDDFDIAKADLKPDHTAKLDLVVTKMKDKAELRAQLGGAADLTGDPAFNQALSEKRATNARDYLVSKGVDVGRLEVQSYGADWARVEAEAGKNEGKNRRVQIWLH